MLQLKTTAFEQKFIATGRSFYHRLNKKLTATQWFLLLYALGLCFLLTVVFLLKLAIKLL
jgi:hypothetical protein